MDSEQIPARDLLTGHMLRHRGRWQRVRVVEHGRDVIALLATRRDIPEDVDAAKCVAVYLNDGPPIVGAASTMVTIQRRRA